jgi:DEAD/DEAH box helicase domain-containing protein
VLCSATIRNPGELAERLTGRPCTVVDDDGAPRGEKHFVFWNPPFDRARASSGARPTAKAATLTAGLLEAGAQASPSPSPRVAAELVYRYARERLQRIGRGSRTGSALSRRLPARGAAQIEQALFSGELRARGVHQRARARRRRRADSTRWC